MDVTPFIRELLFGHDCVIVPGFGGFIGNYVPAEIDKTSGTFYPPVKKISFNRNLNHNDGLLVGRITGTSEITYGDARTLVEEFVAGIRKKLVKGEKVVFDNIGSFTNNQEGNVQFEPDADANYHLDSFGLDSFQCIPLEGYDVRKRISRRIAKDPVKQSSLRKNLWRAAVIIPLLAVVVIVPLKTDFFKTKIEATSLNPLVSAEFEHNKNAVDDGAIADSRITEESAEQTSIEPDIPELLTVDTDVYCLITGSFKSEQNALSQANSLLEDGFTAEVIPASNGFYRVSAMVSSDLDNAKIKRDSISKKYPGTWISKRR